MLFMIMYGLLPNMPRRVQLGQEDEFIEYDASGIMTGLLEYTGKGKNEHNAGNMIIISRERRWKRARGSKSVITCRT